MTSKVDVEVAEDGSLLVGASGEDVSGSLMIPADADVAEIEDVVSSIYQETRHRVEIDGRSRS